MKKKKKHWIHTEMHPALVAPVAIIAIFVGAAFFVAISLLY